MEYVLGQIDDNNREFVVAYGGNALSRDEQKYSVTEKECLAVLKGIEAYRPYLAHTEFTIVTDNKTLVWLQTAKHTGRLERWALKIQEYNCNIVHRPGKSNCVADALSRRDYKVEVSREVSRVSVAPVVDKPITIAPDRQQAVYQHLSVPGAWRSSKGGESGYKNCS